MKVKELEINAIAGIRCLKMNFNAGVNVICGANGIGKSTILDVIADVFSSESATKLKRNARCEKGSYKIALETAGEVRTHSLEVDVFQPDENKYHGGWSDLSRDFLNFGINRNINYKKMTSVTRDPDREKNRTSDMANTYINADDIKNWFVNRYMFSDKKESLSQEQLKNFEFAASVFGILDENVSFKTVNAQTFDIMLTTSNGDIYLEYLSSGYKSCLYILLGIIKEIEYRYKEHAIYISDFDGIVLIDEVDLHLHPSWQAKLVMALKNIFPNVQFILTTHSPNVLQSLQKEEIIALGSDCNGDTILKELELGEYGLQGWTLEEILRDIMELPSTTSQIYEETLAEFDRAIANEERTQILKQYELLKKMLHPNSLLRKFLAIQVSQWEE